jgi:hypothetical protein
MAGMFLELSSQEGRSQIFDEGFLVHTGRRANAESYHG